MILPNKNIKFGTLLDNDARIKIVLNQIENEIEITCIYAFQSISVYGTFSITIRLMTNSAAKRSIGYGHQEQREGSTTFVKLSVANTLIFSVKPLGVLFFDVPSPIGCVPLDEIFSFRLILPLSRASRA